MKKIFEILIILLFSSTCLVGQDISSSDSMKIVETYKNLFTAIKNGDKKTLINISVDKIYCIICFNSTDFSNSPYMVDKKDFLENHLSSIKNSESYQRATKSKEVILIKENGDRSDITALWTIYRHDELAPGHEGGQFGVYFKKINGEFKFAGMETIP